MALRLVDESSLDVLPRCLAFRILVTACRVQLGASLYQFIVADQWSGRRNDAPPDTAKAPTTSETARSRHRRCLTSTMYSLKAYTGFEWCW